MMVNKIMGMTINRIRNNIKTVISIPPEYYRHKKGYTKPSEYQKSNVAVKTLPQLNKKMQRNCEKINHRWFHYDKFVN